MITLAAGAEQYTTSTVTTAGFALGLALLGAEHWRWYKGAATPAPAPSGKGKGAAPAAAGGRSLDPKAMIPYWFGLACGILMVACPAGLLGTTAGILRWGGNGLGGTVMSTLTGRDATVMATAAAPGLDGYGAVVVTALAISLWFLRKSIAKATKGKWKKGLFTGVLLCISTGTAAFVAQTVVGGANDLGQFLLGQLATGTIL
ncbi:hypothetical protein [Streptomyces aureus]|uniref:hypothetical protein n=1 Tax=Streptomyces aureus TaxID=193461 RepID=UPI000566A725|nr:hypothetical protein [Streptomyces aureus]